MKRGIALLATLALLLAAASGLCEQSRGETEQARKDRDAMTTLIGLGYFDAEALQAIASYEEYEETYARMKDEAVAGFQKDSGLPQTGELDEATMDTLLPDYEESRRQEALGSLVIGCMGEDVAQLQTDLLAMAYYTGDVTGHFGLKTQNGVLAYQKANGLEENGYVTPELLAEIHAEAGDPAEKP